MKKLFYIFAIFSVFIIFPGCQMFQGSCITIEGSKGEYSGGITYCFDTKKSESLGNPVMTGEDENGEMQEFFGISEDDINKIIDKIEGEGDVSVNAQGVEEREEKHPVERLKELLE